MIDHLQFPCLAFSLWNSTVKCWCPALAGSFKNEKKKKVLLFSIKVEMASVRDPIVRAQIPPDRGMKNIIF